MVHNSFNCLLYKKLKCIKEEIKIVKTDITKGKFQYHNFLYTYKIFGSEEVKLSNIIYHPDFTAEAIILFKIFTVFHMNNH